jgi:hypothetical protein
MTTLFRVPIHGNVALLMTLSAIYLFLLLATGLLVSLRANTQVEPIQGWPNVAAPYDLSALLIALSARAFKKAVS